MRSSQKRSPKLCSEWSDREIHSSHGDPFREHFCAYVSGQLSGSPLEPLEHSGWPRSLERHGAEPVRSRTPEPLKQFASSLVYINCQHDTHTHTPSTLVNLEIGCRRNQLEIKKAAEHRQELQKQKGKHTENTRSAYRNNKTTRRRLRQRPKGARAGRAPPWVCCFCISVCASSSFLVYSLCFCSSWRCSAAFLISS